MSTAKRGITRTYLGKGISVEKICTCECHNTPGMLHAAACCYQAKTEEDKKAVEKYNDSHR